MNKLWGFINAEQLILYMPLDPGIKYPANVAIVNENLREVMFFSFVTTDFIDEAMLT